MTFPQLANRNSAAASEGHLHGVITNPGYGAFFDALLDGRLKLGQTLRQEELCEILGISLSPLREITTLLEAEGLIRVRRRVGITIFYPDVKFVGDTYQFRGLLEREGLRRFSKSVTGKWLEETRQAHADIIQFVRSAKDHREYQEPVKLLERAFHGSFIGTFGNAEISSIYTRLTQKMFLLRLLNLEAVGPAATEQSMREHLTIVDALESGDTEGAIEALGSHLSNVLHRVLAI